LKRNHRHTAVDGIAARPADPGAAAPDRTGFPRIYAVSKWAIIILLSVLAVLAAVFWTLVLGGFAGSGFHAPGRTGGAGERIAITPECAWPYGVNDRDAETVCRMFYNMTPEQRAQALKTRKQND